MATFPQQTTNVSTDQKDKLDTLQTMFCDIERDVLQIILEQNGENLEKTIDILLKMHENDPFSFTAVVIMIFKNATIYLLTYFRLGRKR